MDELLYRDMDMCAPDSHVNPWPMYDYLREHDPLYWDAKNELWYAFRYDDVATILKDPERFGSREGNRPHMPPDASMIHQDGEQHTRQRALISKGFTPRAMREAEPHCAEIVRSLVDVFEIGGTVELVEALAAPLPAMMIGDMVGAPRCELPRLRGLIAQMVVGGQGPEYVSDEVNEAFGGFCEYHEAMLEARVGVEGDDDLLLRWMHAEIDGEKLNDEQLLWEHVLLFAGGLETTRNAIAGGMEALAERPEQWAYLRAHVDDDTVIEAAVEEMIRFSTPFANMFRTAFETVAMHGKTIEAGQQIGLMFPSANRDPRVFTDPHRFDVRRDHRAERHIAFGLGAHFCIGANLARLEIRTALRELLRRFSSVSLPPEGRRDWVASSFVRGPSKLDLVFGRG